MASDLNFFLTEVEDYIFSNPEYIPASDFNLKKYIGTSRPFRGWTTPYTRSVYQNFFSFKDVTSEQQLEIWDYVWKHGQSYESAIFALMFLKDHYKKMDPILVWKYISEWTPQIDNWVFSDELSARYSWLLEKAQAPVLSQLQAWNTSENPWERRQSVVSLLYYHRHRTVYLSFRAYIDLVQPLMDDSEYYVQKGVGWALREIYQQYPQETLSYIFSHAAQISSAAYTAVTEKLSKEDRDAFRELRKALRR